MLRSFCPDDIIKPGQIPFQDMFVQEKQGLQSLVLGRCRYFSVDGKIGKKSGYFLLSHYFRMAFIVKENESAYPVNMRLFGAKTVMS